MAANGHKSESGLVKNEPGMDDLDMADVDEAGGYEDDTGELVMPSTLPNGWLLRVPKDLWALLKDVKDDEEITIGEVRIWNNPPDDGSKEKRTVRLNLNPSISGKDLGMVPKEYDLTSQAGQANTKNTFVFSEKNLPGFKPRSHLQGGRMNSNAEVLKSTDGSDGSAKIQKRRGPRTIPKRTEYLCAATQELVCTPRDNAEYREIEARKRAAATNTSNRTAFISSETAARDLQKQGMQTSLGEESFIHTAVARKRGAQDNKATRMPKGELLDALGVAFSEFNYWPMSALKKRLRQPEAWLKEVLSEIAILMRNGQAANHYRLKNEHQTYNADEAADDVKAEDMAPEVKGEDDDDEDEDMDFEDVPA